MVSDSPRYVTGNWDLAAGKSPSTSFKSIPSHLIRVMLNFSNLVLSPETTRNLVKISTEAVTSSFVGLVKIVVSSSYIKTLMFRFLSLNC